MKVKLLFLLLILLVFKSWFSFKPVTARDWIFLYPQNLKELPKIPTFWDNQGLGMGQLCPHNWFFFYFSWSAKFLNFLGLSWPVIEKIVWFWPYLLLSIFSSTFLFKTLFPKNKFWIFAPFLFLFNTFSLIITDGGQIIFAMAYALAPLVIALFINLLMSSRVQELKGSRVNPANFTEVKSGAGGLTGSVLAGVVLGVQAMFDPRVAYITMMAVGTYLFIKLLTNSKINPANFTEVKSGASELKGSRFKGLKTFFSLFHFFTLNRASTMYRTSFWCMALWFRAPFSFLLSLFIAVGLNLFWLLPVILTRGPVLPETYGETGWVEFLSFARFSGALSLLHPFWPENIFGKTYFFRPIFLILPVLAYISLLFIGKNGYIAKWLNGQQKNSYSSLVIQPFNHITILSFSLLGLLGAFLAKGSNPPFGEVYLWLFKNVPGMNTFRDPIKFYVLIAIGYSVLIPFSISRSYEFLKDKFINLLVIKKLKD